MTLEPFKPEHAEEVDVQPGQMYERTAFTDVRLRALARCSIGHTMRDDLGRVVACCGSLQMDDGSMLWCLLSENAGRHMVAIYRLGLRLIAESKAPVYATATHGFAEAARLLRMLGFTPVGSERFEGHLHDVFVRAAA